MFSAILATALALNQFFSAPTLAGAHTGAIVIDAQTGNVLYARNASDAFIPASTMKLIVGSAALDILDEAFNFTTTLSSDDHAIYLTGGGDPLLTQTDVDEAAGNLSDDLRMRAQIEPKPQLPGALIGDDTRYTGARYPDGWQVDDLPYDYAAPVSALSFDHNALHITVFPRAAAGEPTSVDIKPSVPATLVTDLATTGAPQTPDTTDLRLQWESPMTVAITGSVAADAKVPSYLDAAILDPSTTTLEIFASAFKLDAHLGKTPANTHLLWQHRSKPLPYLLGAMWKPSDNLLAETLLEEIGVATPGADDTRARGITRETGWLQGIGIDPKTVTIADGSGMSSYDRVTPTVLVKILSHDWFSSHRATMLDALPVAGQSGTLEHLFSESPLAGNVFAKTGTSNHTRTLAGYIRTPSGWRIFALMINDWMDSGPGSADRLHAFQTAFLRGTYEGTASR